MSALRISPPWLHAHRVAAAWADVIKVSIYRGAEMMRVKLCEATQITANPLAFSLGCAINKHGNLVKESPDSRLSRRLP
jgi:hypothetical protein